MTEIRLAPMAGITDWPFRLLCFEQGCDAATTEMVSAMGYVYAPRHRANVDLLTKAEGEGRLFAQIFGKDPELMARAAREIGESGKFVGIDVNMGCPAHKVSCAGEGAGLMREPEKAEKILRAVIAATELPVSVKFRLGWDEEHVNVADMAAMAEDCGVREIAVHGRTRMQQYSGHADWEAIGRVKRRVSVPVFGNGDVFAPEDALKLLEISGCDGVLIGRGSMGNPWLFGQIRAALAGQSWREPTVDERIVMAVRHIDMLTGWKPEHVAVREMRKHIGWYFHGLHGAAQLRGKINTLPTAAEVKDALSSFREDFCVQAGNDTPANVDFLD